MFIYFLPCIVWKWVTQVAKCSALSILVLWHIEETFWVISAQWLFWTSAEIWSLMLWSRKFLQPLGSMCFVFLFYVQCYNHYFLAGKYFLSRQVHSEINVKWEMQYQENTDSLEVEKSPYWHLGEDYIWIFNFKSHKIFRLGGIKGECRWGSGGPSWGPIAVFAYFWSLSSRDPGTSPLL